jgi:hypothetical protein
MGRTFLVHFETLTKTGTPVFVVLNKITLAF